MFRYDLPIGAVGLLLAIYRGLPVVVADGVVAIQVRGLWYKSTGDDVRELEDRGMIAIDENVTITTQGKYCADRYAKAVRRGLIVDREPEQSQRVIVASVSP